MRKLSLSLAFAVSAVVLASIQAHGSGTLLPKIIPNPEARACKALVQEMERSPFADTWRTWKCRYDRSPDTAETTTLLQEIDR